MIIVSAGMQKAGSAWLFKMMNDLLVSNGNMEVFELRDKFELDDVLVANCNIGKLSQDRLDRLLIPHLAGQNFVVKSHSKPTQDLLNLMKLGIAKATYIYRDPRAVALSAYDHGQRNPKCGFAKLDTIEKAINKTLEYLAIYDAWKSLGGAVLTIRYEDMLTDTIQVMRKVADYMAVKINDSDLQEIIQRYNPKSKTANMKGLHYHKGQRDRYREVMTLAQLELCDRVLGKKIARMGYKPSLEQAVA